ncbi:hypothetical protein LUZ61_000443 [Rhynchospora tenuis]|uniref:UPF3 domain-containing protein n=1 Tax=Rhynchospora tenuis TaxID=198213 RepID=A0AAD5ZF61_9POAL|nr:hypothetical protein LUZ61_000443 [Rhynchospora tenuis]
MESVHLIKCFHVPFFLRTHNRITSFSIFPVKYFLPPTSTLPQIGDRNPSLSLYFLPQFCLHKPYLSNRRINSHGSHLNCAPSISDNFRFFSVLFLVFFSIVMKDPLNRTKVVLRHLPPSLPQQAIMDQIDARFSGRFDWVQFRQGKTSTKHQRYSRVYLSLLSSQDVVDFAEFFNGRSFVNEKGAQYKAVVEYAPSQRVPKATSKKDGREGTIDKDPDYMQFLEQISKPVESLPSAEIQLERKEAEKAAAGKEAPVVTPLMVFIRQKRAAKNGPSRSSAGSGRVSSSRKSVSIHSSSPGASSKRSDRRRGSNSTYVVKDGSKEKPMYILASRREEQTNKDKDVAISASKNSDAPVTSSGAIAGSSVAVEAGRGKIILLKPKGKETLQDSDVPAPQQNMVPTRSSPVHTSNNEPIERIVRGIPSNRDTRPPRGANTIRPDGDDRIPMDERYGAINTPSVEKMDRSNRSRDRPDRGVWTPLRYSDRPQNLSGSVERGSFSHHAPGHGERKAEIVSVRRDEMRGHGNGRGNMSSLENGSQRHSNRRGPPRGPKEVESSMDISEGKHSKRATSGYNAHERQVWVQKTGSAAAGVCGNVEGQFWFLQLVLPLISWYPYPSWSSQQDYCQLGTSKPRKYRYPVFYTKAVPALAEWRPYGTSTSITVAMFLNLFQNERLFEGEFTIETLSKFTKKLKKLMKSCESKTATIATIKMLKFDLSFQM